MCKRIGGGLNNAGVSGLVWDLFLLELGRLMPYQRLQILYVCPKIRQKNFENTKEALR